MMDNAVGHTKGMDAFWLKLIAIAGMTFNHIGHAFGPMLSLPVKVALYLPGGLTFPIMAFLLIEGYKKTSNVKRYMTRLLIFAMISAPPFVWALGMMAFDVMFTLLLGLIVLWLRDKYGTKPRFWWMFFGIVLLSAFCDWAIMGVLLIFGMYVIEDKKQRILIPLGILVGSMVVSLGLYMIRAGLSGGDPLAMLPDLAFYGGTVGAAFLLLNYNGQRGRSMKYFFYAYYPLHLLLLGLIRGLCFGIWRL